MNYEVNYELLLEAVLTTKVGHMLNVDDEYFTYLGKVSRMSNDIDVVSDRMTEMSHADQLALLKTAAVQGEICKALKEKYGF